MKNRSIKLIFFGLCAGAIIGTLIGNVISFLLPDGSAVKQFFLISYDFNFGSMDSNHLIDLGVIVVDFGFILKFNVCSIIGFGIAYYLLKYFR
ncbi:MAG: hypothetical protein CMG16_00070 [Candidatus Marinimicrobia bacterium]|nr:hypothetical protein [Candidatus Neomarinimicrobiota bacterium]|tara:strand:+ start:3370 stop:3648 length:279 start_codon:yes stop_codon:yes gene_type:complete